MTPRTRLAAVVAAARVALVGFAGVALGSLRAGRGGTAPPDRRAGT